MYNKRSLRSLRLVPPAQAPFKKRPRLRRRPFSTSASIGTFSVLTRTSKSTSSFEFSNLGSDLRRQKAKEKLDLALTLALAPKTTNNYNKSVKQYLAFARSIGVEENEALPCSDELLCLFVAQGIGRTGPGNAKNLISGIRQWHVREGLPWNPLERIKLIKRALLACWPKRTGKKELRPAISAEMVKMLAKDWKNGSQRESCAMAMALAAWCGQMRLGELMPEKGKETDRTRLPARFEWALSSTKEGASTIELPWTKTTNFDGATIFLLHQRDVLFDATRAMGRHFRKSSLDDCCLLCEYLGDGGSVEVMDKVEFLDMCNQVWSLHGLDRITGHSFRIGGTTSLLKAGVDPQIVKQMGRWRSDAFLLYWRSQDDIFSSHAADIDWDQAGNGGLGERT